MVKVRKHQRKFYGSVGFHSGKPIAKVSPFDADHPARQMAISVIEQALEPALRHDIDGDEYYDKEDSITDTILHSQDKEHAASQIAENFKDEYMEATGRDPYFGKFREKILKALK